MHLSALFSQTNRTRAFLLGQGSYIFPLIVGLVIAACFLPPPEIFGPGDGDGDSGPTMIALVPRVESLGCPMECQRKPHKLNNPTLAPRSIARVQLMYALGARGKDGGCLLRSFCLLRC